MTRRAVASPWLQELSGVNGRTAVIHEDLKALIKPESARRLARVGWQRAAAQANRAKAAASGVILVDTSVWIDHLRGREPALLTAKFDKR